MKKVISLAAAAGISAVLALSSFAADFGKVTVMGDSIATGYGLDGYSSGDNFSASGSFANLIRENDCDSLQNCAVDGRTSEELLLAIQNGEVCGVQDSDSVIISIGGNDFLRPMIAAIQEAIISDTELLTQLTSGELNYDEFDGAALFERFAPKMLEAAMAVDVSETAANLNEIVSELHKASPDCEIFILTVYNPFEGLEEMTELSEAAETKLRELNSAVCSLEGVTVIDAYSAFKGKAADYTNILSGDIHPNSTGHAEIYRLLKEADADVPAMNPVINGAPNKTSPDTGVSGAGLALGVLALSGAAVALLRKSR